MGMTRTAVEIEDELLVLGAQAGDVRALGALYARWHARLGRHAGRLVGDPEAAGDIAQEAWLAIARSIRRLDDPARFRAWAYRIVTRRAADWIRKARRDRRLGEELANDVEVNRHTVTEQDSGADDMDLIRRALKTLPPDRRALLALYYFDELTVAEIAEALAIPRGNVKSRLHHARNHLRHALERSRP